MKRTLSFLCLALFSVGTLFGGVEAPKILEATRPAYPDALKAEGVDGRVKLEILVSETGDVAALEVLESSHEAFSEAAVKSVKAWKFQPAMKDGVPVARKIRLPLDFQIPLTDRLQAMVAHDLFVPEPQPVYRWDDLEKAYGSVEAVKAAARRPVKQGPPRYPKRLRAEGVRGAVVIEFTVSREGNVINPQIVESTDARLEVLALVALIQWKWEPILLDGDPIFYSQKWKFNFPSRTRP